MTEVPAGNAELETICRGIADVVGVAGQPSRVMVRLGTTCVEVEWPEPVSVGGNGHDGPAPARADGTADAAERCDGDGVHEVCALLVGTFYRSPEPGASAFVAVGDTVHAGQQVAIVEAMKLMNSVEADVAGTVSEILAENAETVEYGQPLMRIVTNAS